MSETHPRLTLQHSQFSSQHNVSRPGLGGGFGSTPHIPREVQYFPPQDEYPQYQYRDIEQDFGRFFLHDAAPAPTPQRRTWAQHAQLQQENELRGWQVCLAQLCTN